jgi:hypothetical protein
MQVRDLAGAGILSVHPRPSETRAQLVTQLKDVYAEAAEFRNPGIDPRLAGRQIEHSERWAVASAAKQR